MKSVVTYPLSLSYLNQICAYQHMTHLVTFYGKDVLWQYKRSNIVTRKIMFLCVCMSILDFHRTLLSCNSHTYSWPPCIAAKSPTQDSEYSKRHIELTKLLNAPSLYHSRGTKDGQLSSSEDRVSITGSGFPRKSQKDLRQELSDSLKDHGMEDYLTGVKLS